MNTKDNKFSIVSYESGSYSNSLPLWTASVSNPFSLSDNRSNFASKTLVNQVPGAFQFLNVLDHDECDLFINLAESMGYTEDAAVSLGRNTRHNMNLNLIIDDKTQHLLWSRIEPLFSSESDHFLGKKPLGLNQRFRFYRYEKGDYFAYHTDGAWPGSKVVDNKVINDAFGDRYSLFTCLIFLSDDFSGGATEFLVDSHDMSKPARSLDNSKKISIRTAKGGMLLFPHGDHPLHCLHSSELINEGVEYIIRTDVLFSL